MILRYSRRYARQRNIWETNPVLNSLPPMRTSRFRPVFMLSPLEPVAVPAAPTPSANGTILQNAKSACNGFF